MWVIRSFLGGRLGGDMCPVSRDILNSGGSGDRLYSGVLSSVALSAIDDPATIEITSGTVPSSAIQAMAEIAPTTITSDAIGIRRNQLIVLPS